jgi:hypothetical protein
LETTQPDEIMLDTRTSIRHNGSTLSEDTMPKKTKFKVPGTWREIEIEKARREGRAEGYAWGYDAAQYTMQVSREELEELNKYVLCYHCAGTGSVEEISAVCRSGAGSVRVLCSFCRGTGAVRAEN